ncbi:sulfatase-like hydrolase/transferase [Inquilinus limosus]|uniref:sulfatase-like hydrolase/transferase n=1 Tax=Inquilinus limosus TaxID=171674 RepID=UPI000684F02A|nr:sulfatase-like hydrolase/transferase [Inquilinus limosus]
MASTDTALPRLRSRLAPLLGGLRVAAALVWLTLLLGAPSDPNGWQAHGLVSVPVELAVLVALLALAPPLRRSRALAAALGGLGLGLAALKLADLVVQLSFGRPVNLYVDRLLLVNGLHLATGVIGAFGLIGLTLAALVAGWGVWWATMRSIRALQRALAASAPRRAAAGGLAVLAILAFAVGRAVPDAYGAAQPVGDVASHMIADQVGRLASTLAMAGRFRAEEAADPLLRALPGTPLAGLGGADVAVVFIESYGRSALEDPRFDAAPTAALAEAAPKLAAAGVHTASGWLASPTRGGQSWLAHATLASGLEVDNQLRYDLLVTGKRMTLVRLFADAGYRTALIAPAITRPLPEATRFYGFDQTLFADDLGYAGPPFGWVTMPDQYTLAAYERWRRHQPRPLFSEVVLVSSHAPWTPVPTMVEDWDSIGDGSLYRTLPAGGGTPEEVWRDPDRIRTQYGLSVAYSLRAVLDYAARRLDEQTLMIVLGDHQPAPIVTGPGTPRDVPVHVFSRDPDLVARFRDWGFADGLVPPAAGPVAPMAGFRDAFARSFSP